MAFNSSSLLPGQSPPLTTITATNQSGIIIIATALGLALAFISLLIRVYLQLEIRHSISSDDIAVIGAFALAVAQAGVAFAAASKGFGKTLADIPQENLIPIQKILYTSDILYITVLWGTKLSVAFLTLRLSALKTHNLVSKSIIAFSSIFAVISVFLISIRCDISHPWLFLDGQCGNVMPRWDAIAAFDAVTEVGLFATSVYLVAGLQLSLSKKSIVIFAFGLRLPVLIVLFLRLHYLPHQISGPDPTLDGTTSAVLTQIQLAYAIFAATTPCLRPFMTALSTNYGAPAHVKTPKSTKASGAGGNYSLSDMSKGSRVGRVDRTKPPNPVTRWDKIEHKTRVEVRSGTADNYSLESNSSKRMIISKDTDWSVDYEGQVGRAER